MANNGAERELQLKISTAADVAGAQQAERALDKVAEKATAVSEEQKDAAKAALAGLTAPAYGEKIKHILGQTEGAARGASKEFTALKQSGDDVRRVFTGIQGAAEGGTRGIVGMLNAGRGLVGIFARIGSVLAGPVGLGLGAAAAGIAYLGRVAKQNQAAIEKVFAEAATRSGDLKTSVEALQKESEKSFAAQVKDVEALEASYGRLLATMDRVGAATKLLNESRTGVLNATMDRDEQAALAKAKTPEERERIARQFATKRLTLQQERDVAGLSDTELNAKNRLEAAQRASRGFFGQREQAEAAVAAAERDSANATAAAAEVGRGAGIGSSAHQQALAEANRAAAALKAARENATGIFEKTAGGIDKADAEQQQARATLELVELQRQQVKLAQETLQIARTTAAKPQLEDARARAQAAMQAGDAAAQDKAVAEIKLIEGEVKRVPPALSAAVKEAVQVARDVGEVTIKAINGVSTEQKRTLQRMDNMIEQQ